MPKYSARIAALLLATTLCMPLMGGCDASGGTAGTSGTTDATNSAADTDGTTGTRAGSAASSTDAASSSDTAVQSSALTYEGYLDESGLWDGVRALDYVTLPEDYAHISVPADQVAVNDDDVQAQIDSLASSYATTAEVTDRAVEDGDTVNIDYVGTIDGVEFDGGSTQGAGTTVTIGVTSYIDDFLEQLIGHMPGETFDVEVTFPDDYGVDELNGKDAVFSVTINHIEEQELPTIDDEWVTTNLESSLGVSTLDELKSSIRDSPHRQRRDLVRPELRAHELRGVGAPAGHRRGPGAEHGCPVPELRRLVWNGAFRLPLHDGRRQHD